MLHFNTSWEKKNTSFFHHWFTLAWTIYYIYFCHLLTSNFLHSSSILYIFRFHWPILFPFSIKLCYKINTTQDVTLSGTFAISISSKLKYLKQENIFPVRRNMRHWNRWKWKYFGLRNYFWNLNYVEKTHCILFSLMPAP